MGGGGGDKAVSNAYYLNVSKHKLQQTFSYYAVCEENTMYLYLYTVYTHVYHDIANSRFKNRLLGPISQYGR